MEEYIPKELADEYNELTEEWFRMIDLAQMALKDLKNREIDKAIETVIWLVDHNDRVRSFDDKLDIIFNKENINWN